MNVLIKRERETAKIPTKAHREDACFDIYSDLKELSSSVRIDNRATTYIPTGFSTAIPTGYCALVYARSGLASKNNVRPSNCVAVIDSNYRGEWMIPLIADTDENYYISHNERIAQFMIAPVLETHLIEVEELDETDRGDGRFGSSGK